MRVTAQSFDPAQAVGTGDTRRPGNYQGSAAASGRLHDPIRTDIRTGDAQILTAAVRPPSP